MFLDKGLEQASKLLIDNDTVNLAKIENVVNIGLLQPVVNRDYDTAGSGNAVDGLEEGRRIGRENTDAEVVVLLQVVSQSPSTIGKLAIRALENDAIGGDVVDCLGIWLDGGSSLEEEGRGEVMDMCRDSGLREQMAENGTDTGRRP